MPAPSLKQTSGAIHSVPCPHCGHGNDFRQLAEELAAGGVMGAAADTGQAVFCDNCDQKMIVVSVQKVTVIHVRQPKPEEQ